MTAAPARGTEAEFLHAIRQWQPAAHVAQTNKLATAASTAGGGRHKAGPSARAAAAAAAAAASDGSSPSRYFLLLEQAPADPSSSASAAAASSAASAASASASPAARPTALHLLASNIAGSWRGLLDLSAFRRHRESLGIGALSWAELLQMVRECWNTPGRVVVSQGAAVVDGDAADDAEESWGGVSRSSSGGRSLTVLLRYSIGSEVELESRFVLAPVGDNNHAAAAASSSAPVALSASQLLLSHLLFGVFSQTAAREASTLAPLQSALASAKADLTAARNDVAHLRSQLAALEAERSNWMSAGGGSGSGLGVDYAAGGSYHGSYGAGAAAGGAADEAPKRKVMAKPKNQSVLNPNAKRRKTGAIKIE